VDAVRPLVPAELEIDTYDGDAWVGLIPFRMSGVRPWWSPPIPWLSRFAETNVRTYVHCRGCGPGVWFFTLDATNPIVVRIARTLWHLNYYDARLTISSDSGSITWQGRRSDKSAPSGEYLIRADLSPELPKAADPATLEHFLVERYVLYARSKRGQLCRGRVHHQPYAIQSAALTVCRQTMLPAMGLDVTRHPDHAVFCAGVDVAILRLRTVDVGRSFGPGDARPAAVTQDEVAVATIGLRDE